MAIPKADPQPEFIPASERPSAETGENFSFELVTKIAARLLVGEDYAGAAKRSISLLRACRHELVQNLRKAEIMARARENAQDKDARVLKRDGKPFVMTWRELYEYITGEAREERAVPKLRRYLTYLYRKNEALRLSVPLDKSPSPTMDQIAAFVAKLKSEGMYSVPALGHQDEYAAWKTLGIKEIEPEQM